MEYMHQQKVILRSVKKELYNKLYGLGIQRGWRPYQETAKLYHSWRSVESVRQEERLILSKVYSDRFFPIASCSADSNKHNNLICCCLMQLISPPDISDITLPAPAYFAEINHDEAVRVDTQNLIYSKLSQLLDNPKKRVSYHDDLIKSIIRLERRVKELEKLAYGIST
jgi:hypothetical protein